MKVLYLNHTALMSGAERSLLTLVTLVGVWAICRGVSEIFAGFTPRQVPKQADRLGA